MDFQTKGTGAMAVELALDVVRPRPWAAVAVLVLGSLLGLFSTLGDQPLLAWFPGENRLGGTLLRVSSVAEDVRLIAVHRPNAVVLQSSDPWFSLRLAFVGGIPVPMPVADALCRSPGP
jgi:hypothetical protein